MSKEWSLTEPGTHSEVNNHNQTEHRVPVSRAYVIPIHNGVSHQSTSIESESSIQPDLIDSNSEGALSTSEETVFSYKRTHPHRSNLFRRYPENILGYKKRIYYNTARNRTRSAHLVAFVLALILVQLITPLSLLERSVQAAVFADAGDGWATLERSQTYIADENYTAAEKGFRDADRLFQNSLSVLQQTGQVSLILPYLSSSDTYACAQSLLQVARKLSQAGIEATFLLRNLKSAIDASNVDNTNDPLAPASAAFEQLLNHQPALKSHAFSIRNTLYDAETLLKSYASNRIDNPELEAARKKAWSKIPSAAYAADMTYSLIDAMPTLLGADRNRRYMILFQNNHELRPSGGFIGSFGTTILKKGQIDGFAVETNIYKRDHSWGKLARVEAPYPLSHITKEWYLRDANIDVDFAEAARRTAWFYKLEGGTDLDGIVAIDTSLIISLLKVVGPIAIPKQNVTMTAENFVENAIYKSEREYLVNPAVNALNEPKMFLADMFPLLLGSISAHIRKNPQELFDVFGQMIREKHLLFSPFFEEGSAFSEKTHMANALPHDSDFLMVNNANLGGLKSSLSVNQEIQVQIEATNHNTLRHTVVIKRTHTGSSEWPDGDNHNYIRLVVPKTARYIKSSSTGFEPGVSEIQADVEARTNYQTFGRWLTTPVGASKLAEFEYETPLDLGSFGTYMYRFDHIKQPGTLSDELTVIFKNNASGAFNTSDLIYHNPEQKTNEMWVIPFRR